MLTLREFRYNHHPSGVKMLAKFARRGIRVVGGNGSAGHFLGGRYNDFKLI